MRASVRRSVGAGASSVRRRACRGVSLLAPPPLPAARGTRRVAESLPRNSHAGPRVGQSTESRGTMGAVAVLDRGGAVVVDTTADLPEPGDWSPPSWDDV